MGVCAVGLCLPLTRVSRYEGVRGEGVVVVEVVWFLVAVSMSETDFSVRTCSPSILSMRTLTLVAVSAWEAEACLMNVTVSSSCLVISDEVWCCWWRGFRDGSGDVVGGGGESGLDVVGGGLVVSRRRAIALMMLAILSGILSLGPFLVGAVTTKVNKISA